MKHNKEVKTIGIDARMYGYAQTGIGNYIRHLVGSIIETDKKNNFVIFLNEEEFDSFPIKSERIKKIKIKAKWYSWREQLIFPYNLYKERLDLMHFTHFNSPILYLGKSIVTIHDITPYFFPGHKMKSIIRKAGFRLVFSSSVRKAKKVIAVSNATKKDIVTYFKIKPEKIEVIYEGADQQFKVTEETEIENLKHKYHLNKPFLFYTGVWRNHKNLVGLIKAFKIVKERYQLDINLVLGGKEDPYYPEVRKTWQELELGQEIIPVGFIDQKELPIFYNAAYAFIIPSFYEGFGLIGLEAMNCRTPVISSNSTSLPEILGDAAIYFDPNKPEEIAEKIHLVFRDKVLYNKLKIKGFEQAKKYSWDEMNKKTSELYQENL
jgi:glycosyltransferase involved in cell wall biosynthesis